MTSVTSRADGQATTIEGEIDVHVDQRRRGRIDKRVWRWLKRRAAVEPTIGHMKERYRLNRNRLKGSEGDHLNGGAECSGDELRKAAEPSGPALAPDKGDAQKPVDTSPSRIHSTDHLKKTFFSDD